jgi:hypothetical protein
MKHPLVAVVFAYAAGLLLAQLFQAPLLALFALSFLLLVLALFVRKLRPLFLWSLLALAGWTNYTVHTVVIAPNDLRLVLGNQTAIATVCGTLAETPRLKIAERDGQELWRSVARVRVNAIRRAENFVPTAGVIIVSTPGPLGSNYFAGQAVEIAGVIAPPAPQLAEGLFDYRDEYRQSRRPAAGAARKFSPHKNFTARRFEPRRPERLARRHQ